MGVRVNAAEIEALIHASGLATELAVIGVPHDLLGHEIWCFAVPAAASAASAASADGLRALRAWCHAQLSPYQLPRRFEGLAALPKTRTNKIDYPALRRLAAARPSASVVETAR
jgi:long-chain acyl-CoA synthetase